MNQSSKLTYSCVVSFDVIGTEVVGVLDSSKSVTLLVYHSQCEVFVDCASEWCGYCPKHRKTLTAMHLVHYKLIIVHVHPATPLMLVKQ